MFFIPRKKVVLIALLSSFLLGSATAAKLTKMQMAAHTSPMPGLMMLVNMNVDELGLDNEQLEVIHEWRRTHNQPVQDLMSEIYTIEKEITESVLEGISAEEMAGLKGDLLSLRGELIETKYQCVANIRKTLDEEQWQQLMTLRDKSIRVQKSGGRAGNEIQAFLRVSPMPKLMAIILMHKKELMLTGKQHERLEQWRLENMNHWALLFEQVLNTEKKITQRSLEMESNASLMKEFDAMTKSRRRMAQMSLDCRDNMKKVLSVRQWKEVVRLLNSYI